MNQEHTPTVCMTESEVVERLASHRYNGTRASITFKNAQGHTMSAWRSKHAVHVRRQGTSVRGTASYHLPRSRTVVYPKASPFANHTLAELKDECRRLGLKVSGKKSVLLQRLHDEVKA